jgi:phage recombination protein Bet
MNQLSKTEQDESMVSYTTPAGDVNLSASMIMKYLTRGGGMVTKQECIMFLNLCKYNQINPFLNEAYLIKYGNQSAQMVIGKETFLKRANNSSNYKGFKAGVIILRNNEVMELDGCFYLDKDELIGGWAEVHTTNRIPLKHTVKLSEFIQKKKTGEVNSNWKQKPGSMVRKVALCQALRECLPETYQGLFSEEEFPQAENIQKAEKEKPVDIFETEVVSEVKKNPEPEPAPAPKQELIDEEEEVAPFLDPNFNIDDEGEF